MFSFKDYIEIPLNDWPTDLKSYYRKFIETGLQNTLDDNYDNDTSNNIVIK